MKSFLRKPEPTPKWEAVRGHVIREGDIIGLPHEGIQTVALVRHGPDQVEFMFFTDDDINSNTCDANGWVARQVPA